MNGISINELLHLNNPNIIDIRDNYNYAKGHLSTSKNIPYYSLLINYSIYLDKNENYYLYCNYGHQSKEISDKLNSYGYHTFYVKEGYLFFKNNLN